MLFVLRGIQNPYGNPWIPCFAVKLGFFTGSIRSFIFKIYFIIANIVIKTVQTPAKKIQRIANIKFFWQIDAGILDFVYKLLFLADDPVNIADPFAALLCEILRFVADLGAGSILNGLTVANLTAEVIQFFTTNILEVPTLKETESLLSFCVSLGTRETPAETWAGVSFWSFLSCPLR